MNVTIDSIYLGVLKVNIKSAPSWHNCCVTSNTILHNYEIQMFILDKESTRLQPFRSVSLLLQRNSVFKSSGGISLYCSSVGNMDGGK